MAPSPDLTWQPTLFGSEAPGFDPKLSSLQRIELDPESWVDYVPEWVSGSDELFSHVLEDIRQALSAHYGIEFDSVGFNLYRDGRDSVAWHGDHIKQEIEEPLAS